MLIIFYLKQYYHDNIILHMKIIFSILLINLCFLISAQSLSLNTADTEPYSTEESTGFYDVLLNEVLKNLDIELTINHYPSERSILWADQGHDDGEFARISGLSSMYPNLKIVEEPLVSFYFVALKKADNSINPTSWDDLASLRVGYLNGWKIFADNVGLGTNISQFQNVESLFNILLANRVDVILYSKQRAEAYIRDNKIEGIEIIETPLATRTMHLYLHRKHAALIPSINNEIEKLKKSGRYDKLLKLYLITE